MFDLNKIVTDALQQAVDARITELMQQHANIVGALAERITALENNPAIGTDTVLERRVDALEAAPAVAVDEARMVEALNGQEWFWGRVRGFVDAQIEEAMDEHYSSYDHDSYDSHRDDDDKHIDDDLDSKINDAVSDALSNATVSISI